MTGLRDSSSRNPDGIPGYVFCWCCKANARTMQRGYRDVGYLMAPHLRDFRPPTVARSVWGDTVCRLREFCLTGNAVAVMDWCRTRYPGLLAIIPQERQGEFVAGVIEGVWCEG